MVRNKSVAIRETRITVLSGCALMATAGFSMTTKGCTSSRERLEFAKAIPLKKPATPTPRGTHIFSKREEISSMKDNTGIDVIKEYAAKRISVPISNVPCGKSVIPIFVSARFCRVTATRSMKVKIKNLHRYVSCGVSLVLSGHAHGGQFRLPLIGGLVAPDQGFFPKYDAGLYRDGGTNMIVSRGIGNSIIPLRFNNRPEIVLVELRVEQ